MSSDRENPRTPDRVLNYGRHLVDRDDIDAVVEVLSSDFLTQGPVVERFEAAVAERTGARYAVAVSSGTAALHVACLAAGVEPGSLGVTSAITFSATANAVLYCGGDIRLLDIDPDTLAMTADGLGAALKRTPEIEVVLPVHMAGYAADMAALRKVAGDRTIIEDASHALGGFYADGSAVGCCRHTDMTVFSFHPVKPVTSGEGGMITTNDRDLYDLLRLYRNHGMQRNPDLWENKEQGFPDGDQPAPWYQEQQYLGFNYRMSDIHAAIGLSQLSKLDHFVTRRREIVARYDDTLARIPGISAYQAAAAQRAQSAHHIYIAKIAFEALGLSRSTFIRRLHELRIGTQVHYLPIYRQPFYARRLGLAPDVFPESESYYASCLSLPLFPDMGDDEVEYVIDAVRQVCGG